MATKLIDNNGLVSLSSISCEEDLKLNFFININPPPGDGKCNCCGRHLSELKPFGKAGDPLVGDFNGALLIKKIRSMFPFNKEVNDTIEAYFKDCNTREDFEKAKKELIKKFGEEEAEDILIWDQGYNTVESSWECRDCAILDNKEFHEKFSQKLDQERDRVQK